jgi:uncharacterized protein YgiM (DUF1202 family)
VRLGSSFTLLLSLLLVSCNPQPPKTPSVGEAFVGPATLNLRQELSNKAQITGSAKHGERLEILEYRHRFAKVRTPEGIEGWADTRQLLTPEQMAALRRMAEQASQYPSQGLATTFESLNMHTEPNRASPSFWQIAENGKVDVIGHKLEPRVAPVTQAPAPV